MELNNKQNMLPEGWCWASLEDIVVNPKSDIVDGPFGSNLKASEYIETGVPIIRIQNVDRNRFVSKNIKFISDEKARELKRHSFHSGDIVITKLGDPLGKACIVPEGLNNGIIVADIVRLRLGHNLCSVSYLVYAINSDSSVEQLLIHVKGTTRPRVNLGSIRSLKVPLAPLNEQKRIVAKVEDLLERVNVVRERLARVKEILKRFRQSVLSAACSGRLTDYWRKTYPNKETVADLLTRIYQERLEQYEKLCLIAKKDGRKKPRKPTNIKPQIHYTEFEMDIPETWFWTSLEDIASTRQYAMSSGPFGSALGNKDYIDSGIPVIRGKNIQNGFFLLKEFVYISKEKASELIRSYAFPGDVVVVAVGSSGQAAIVPNNLPKSILSQNCNKITLDKSLALPNFVLFFLQIEIAKNQLRDKTTDTARPFLSLTNLKKTLIAITSLDEQKEIINRVEKFFNLADEIDKRMAAAAERAERLTQAILAKAFRGELVPTEAELARREGRSYETASILLNNIKGDSHGKYPLR